jgi:tetratricopeptide (TPR) repeat protein
MEIQQHKYVFVSFCSRDTVFVKDILSGLAGQNIDFWDYTNDIQEVEVGEVIMDRVKKEIDKCDYFVLLISPNSSDPSTGKYVHLELEYAMELGFIEKEKIISIALKNKEDDLVRLKGVFEKVKSIKYEEIVLDQIPSYVKAISSICRRLKQQYIAPVEAHKRLPFHDLFRKEVIRLSHSHSKYVELMGILGEFNEYFKKGDWEQAHFLISHFLSSCRHKIPGYKTFYPWIVKAVCEQELNLLDEAELSYLKAGEIKPDDQNVYGGLGSIYASKRDFVKAESYFKKSLDCCPPDNNRDEKINYINALLENKKAVPGDLQEFLLELDLSEFLDDELIKIKNIQVALLFQTNQISRALRILGDMHQNSLYDSSTILFYHLCLLRSNNDDKAGTILLKACQETNSRLDKLILNHYLSDFYLKRGEINKAVSIYENYLVCDKNRTRQLFIKYARIFKHLKNNNKVKSICRELLYGKLFPLPVTREDFYYDGFAQYLLENEERASYDFERSDNFDLYYSHYVN